MSDSIAILVGEEGIDVSWDLGSGDISILRVGWLWHEVGINDLQTAVRRYVVEVAESVPRDPSKLLRRERRFVVAPVSA